MNRKSNRWMFGLTCLGLLIAAMIGAGPARAELTPEPPLQTGGWLPFDGAPDPVPPALRLLHSDADIVALQADLPGLAVEKVTVAGVPYTRLLGEGYGHPAAIGLPDLPVLRREVQVPFGAGVAVEVVSAEYTDYTLQELGFSTLYPLQAPVPKLPGAVENAPFVIDGDFYAGGAPYPNNPVSLGEEYVVRGHRVQPVEVWPVAYDPAAGTVRLYHAITFHLRLTGSDMERTVALAERFASPAFEPRLSRQILNYNQGRPAARFGPQAQVGYLIITADAYYDAVHPLADLRSGRGFDVTLTRLSDIPGSGSNSDIQAYIQDAYWSWPTPPSYVLLVGDTNTIPGWDSVSAYEVTDLYYGCMDGGDDWHPDIGRGRFPVRSAAQTTAMVDKYLAYAYFTGEEPWLKKAAFIASCDDWQTAEGTHNYVIGNYTAPNGYSGIFPNNPEPGGDKIYCVTYGGTTQNIRNAANDGRWAIVYSGHGGTYSWAEGQIGFTQSDVNNLSDYGFYPFVGSHACNTGDFAATEAFCETWVLQEGKGALVFWGSSSSSYWDEDDVLERAMFDALFAETQPHADVAAMTDYGLAMTEAAYPGRARYYWETYNVMGDPAVRIFIEPDLPSFTMDVAPREHELCGSGSVTSTVSIQSFLGYSATVYLEAWPLPAGISASFDIPSAPAPFTAVLTLDVAPGTLSGDYAIAVTATDQLSWTHSAVVDLRVVNDAPVSPTLTTPPDGALDQPLAPTLGWEAALFASTYNLRLDTTPLFAAPLVDVSEIADTSYTVESPLSGGRCYWWQVQGDNACGTGDWAAPFHFATVALDVVFYDDMEAGDGQWDHEAAQGSDNWQITTAESHSPTHAWHVPDDNVITDSRLWNITPVAVGAGSTLTFWHQHQFESSYDGAVLEISTNGGSTWSDLGAYITANGYNGTISTCCNNPLGGRQAWVDDLTTWTEVTVDLSAFAGETAQFRWRLGCDYSIGDTGWYIDDVQITAPLPPNPAPGLLSIVPDNGTPYAPTPVQIAGSNFVETPSVRLGETWLLSVTQESPTLLSAVVPAGMAPGVYDLTLYNGDCQQTVLPDAFTVIGQCISPTVALESGAPVELGQPMVFTATLVDGTPPYTYTWDMGGPGEGRGLDSATPVYTYTDYGVFTATVWVENPCGSDSASATAEVLCNPLLAEIAAGGPVTVGQALVLTATVISGTGPFSYSWDFGGPGEGRGLETPTAIYTFSTFGDFAVTATVSGPCGSDSPSVQVTVAPLMRCYVPLVWREAEP
ncbi:MAG: PKD domain-containing protein [Anaerolineae bacterium]|nr:PKD domain-containing protein [Anaerolineae bacterium]